MRLASAGWHPHLTQKVTAPYPSKNLEVQLFARKPGVWPTPCISALLKPNEAIS
jgi:hypothetical protein